MFQVGQKVYHTFLHQECVVIAARREPEFVWSDGKVDQAFDWVDVQLADGSKVGGDAKAFRAISVNLLEIVETTTTLGAIENPGWAWESTKAARPDTEVYVYTYQGVEIGATMGEPATFATLREFAECFLG